jgi:hypothetical protein
MPKRLALIALILTMTGCPAPAPLEIIQTPDPLPLPARPVLPAIQGVELECLSDDAYRRLADRQRRLRQYAEELEVIIKATRTPQP